MVETVRAGTGKSALMMLLVVVVIAAAIAALFLIPGALESIVWILVIIGIAIVAIAAIIFICMVVLAVPMYVAKGEEYQTDVSYSIDDVESVKETSSEEKKAN
ncbi:MAG: hypothetical protein IJL79_02830 [Candidatus Methanomethylophilaceae archaeon]|nr:hypothetical protein [Candidatus Methanomethylophilaceae archaeon]